MIRILLSLAIAAAAFFGPMFADSTGGLTNGMPGAVIGGEYFASDTVGCVLAQNFDPQAYSEACAPKGGFLGMLVAATIGLGVVSAALSVLGLLPFVGRLTSVVTMIAGVVAVVTFAMVAKDLLTTEGAAFTDIRWGAYAMGGFGFLASLAGLGGMRGDS